VHGADVLVAHRDHAKVMHGAMRCAGYDARHHGSVEHDGVVLLYHHGALTGSARKFSVHVSKHNERYPPANLARMIQRGAKISVAEITARVISEIFTANGTGFLSQSRRTVVREQNDCRVRVYLIKSSDEKSRRVFDGRHLQIMSKEFLMSPLGASMRKGPPADSDERRWRVSRVL